MLAWSPFLEKRKEEAVSLAVGLLVDEEDLLLFVDEEAFLHFSSKPLLEVESSYLLNGCEGCLGKLSKCMGEGFGMELDHTTHVRQAHKARGKELQIGAFLMGSRVTWTRASMGGGYGA